MKLLVLNDIYNIVFLIFIKNPQDMKRNIIKIYIILNIYRGYHLREIISFLEKSHQPTTISSPRKLFFYSLLTDMKCCNLLKLKYI